MPYRQAVSQVFLHKLNEIRTIFERQTNYHFYASSLLFVYDGQFCRDHDETNGLGQNGCHDTDVAMVTAAGGDIADVRMIDFTHVIAGQGAVDQNYRQGLQGVIGHLQACLK